MVCITFLVLLLWLRHHAEPIVRSRIVENLESKLHCNVELDQVHVSFRRGLEVNGSGLRIMAIGSRARITPGGTPMLVARSFQFATTVSDLLFHPSSAITAYVQGLVLTIPAADDREHLEQGDPAKRNQPRNSLFLNKLVATDSRLVLERPIMTHPSGHSRPPGPALVFDFTKLILIDPGKNLPFVYEAILTNPKPIGEVHSTGHVGPWVFQSSRKTPVDGNYTFDHADLGTIPGIEGVLSSSGRITGVLGSMAVHGTTELYAILLAGAAGLHVGRAMVFPGSLSVLDAAAAAGRRAATVMVGVVMMLIVAALLEAFARQLVDTSLGRLAIGLFMLVFWTAYLFAWRRRPVVAAP